MILPAQVVDQQIPDNEVPNSGAYITMRLMSSAIKTYPLSCKGKVAEYARLATANALTDEDRAKQLYALSVRLISYKLDPPEKEFIKSPCRILNEVAAAGQATDDCDGYAVMICSLAQAIGMRTGLMAVSNAKLGSGMFPVLDHVFAMVWDREHKQWIPIDPVAPGKNWSGHNWMFHHVSQRNFLDDIVSFIYDIFSPPAVSRPELAVG